MTQAGSGAAVTASLRTARLVLRRWRAADLVPFAALSADPEVMAFYPTPLSAEAAEAQMRGICQAFERRGFGLWAVEAPGLAPFLGYVGLSLPAFAAPFQPCVEIGWRLARPFWGQGFATEAARAALDDARDRCGIAAVVSFTATANLRSRSVMERLGMTHDPAEDFDHPKLAAGNPLQRHVLYRLALGSGT